MIIGLALEVLQKQSDCWDKITECSANCEECECHVDASNLVEAVKTVLDAFGKCSELPNSSDCICRQADLIDRAAAQTELQFAARRYTVAHEAHGEGQVVWNENLISVTDAMNALRKVPSVQARQTDDTEFWKKRAKDYENTINDLISKMTKGVKFNCMEMNAEGITFREEKPSVQAEQKWIPCSERMPEEDHWLGGSGKQFSENVLVTIVNHDDEDIWVDTTHTIDGEWILELPRHCEITAWQQLPESYRGDTDE